MNRFLLFCSILLSFPAVAAVDYGTASVAIVITPSYICTETQCQNEWGECFYPQPDSDNVVDLDTMKVVPCDKALMRRIARAEDGLAPE